MTVSKTNPSDLQIISFSLYKEWEDWLEQNHADFKGIWLRLYKKGSGIASINHSEALDVALCYGWIDGQITWRLQTAKKPETRKKRLKTILEMLERGEKFHN